jgi:hypothetical protein
MEAFKAAQEQACHHSKSHLRLFLGKTFSERGNGFAVLYQREVEMLIVCSYDTVSRF